MQIIRRILHHAAGVCHRGVDEGALGLGHGGEDIDALADGVREAQVQLHQILVEVRELIVEVDQVLILGTCTQYRRRELLSAVGGVIPGKLQAAVFNVLFHIIHIVNSNQAGEIIHQAHQHRDVLVGVKPGLAAVLVALGVAAGLAVEPHQSIALGLIFLSKLGHILGDDFVVVLGLAGKADSRVVGLLANLIVPQELFQVVRIRYIIQVAVLLPLLHHIDLLGVVLLMRIV